MKSKITYLAIRQIPVIVVLASLAMLVLGCGGAAQSPHVVKGPVQVSYELQFTETKSSSSGGQYQEIQIFDQCVVITSQDGRTSTLLPLAKLNRLSWSKN